MLPNILCYNIFYAYNGVMRWCVIALPPIIFSKLNFYLFTPGTDIASAEK